MGIDEVDHNIKPIIEAMNKTGYIETISSCEGHNEDEIYDIPYVKFFCKANCINALSIILNKVYRKFDKGYLMLHIIFDEEIAVCQLDAPTGYLCLQINFCLYAPAKIEDKLEVFKIVEREFTDVSRGRFS